MILMESNKECVGSLVISNATRANDMTCMLINEGYIVEQEKTNDIKIQMTIYKRSDETTVSGDTYYVD